MKNAVIAAIVAAIIASTAAAAGTLITSAQIKDHTIQARDLAPAAIAYLHGQRGATGPAGQPGAPGANGAIDLARISYVTGPQTSIAAGSTQYAEALCPASAKVIGGGFVWAYGTTSVTAEGSGPNATGTGWRAVLGNGSSVTAYAYAYAVCVTP